MPPTPNVPTPLVQVRVHTERGPGVPDVVLVGQSTSDDGPVLGPGADILGIDGPWLTRHRASEAAGAVQAVPLATGRPDHGWLLGTGAGGTADWRTAGAALARTASARAADDGAAGRTTPRTVQVHLPAGVTDEQAAALTVGCVAGSHRYRVTGGEQPARLHAVRLIAPPTASPSGSPAKSSPAKSSPAESSPAESSAAASLVAAVERAEVLGRATGLARDLANTPSDRKDPAWLVGTAAALADRTPGLRATVCDEKWLAEHGFGGVLAVGGGSVRPPRLLQLAWRPRDADGTGHLVLVGKGITFDTGGISIKPAENMHVMRTDMSGGAAVIAAIRAVAELRVPVKVTALVPAAENHVSGSAYRPGDVLRHPDGTTTEVTNTDAEGRLVLADALCHAVRTLQPTALVDVATLTGAMRVALGVRTGALFASESGLADRVIAAGEAVGEAWWRMPLVADHADAVRSDIADLRQCPPGPGGVTAALYLREFTAGLPWAHLDIAGPARAEQSYETVNPGGTGFATRTLVELVCGFTR